MSFIDERINRGLIDPKASVEDRIDSRLKSSALKILDSKIHFVPAKTPYACRLEMFNMDYVHFGPSAPPVDTQPAENSGEKVKSTTGPSAQSVEGLPLPQFEIFPADEICLTWKDETKCSTGVGLQNLGNTCFLNSILQVLVNTPPMVNYLFSEKHNRNYCPGETGFCALCSLKMHVKRVYASANTRADAVSPNHIVQKIRCVMKSHCYGSQEDAHEFLRYFVDAMQTASLYPYKDKKLDLFTKETTPISRVFGGFHRGQIICNNCQYISVTYDPFLDLSLEIKQWNSVESALTHYTRMETLSNENAYLCPRCKKRVSARKILTIHSAPNVLTVHLKRFDHFGKIDRHIAYTERFNMRPYMTEKQGPPVNYRLYGLVVHHGRSTNSGHYFAYVRNPLGQWHLMDDSRVCILGTECPTKIAAYLLFYLRMPTPMATVKPQAKVEMSELNLSSLFPKSVSSDYGGSSRKASGSTAGEPCNNGKRISFKIDNPSVKLTRISPFKIKLKGALNPQADDEQLVASGSLVPYDDDTSDEANTATSSKSESSVTAAQPSADSSTQQSSAQDKACNNADSPLAKDKRANLIDKNGQQRGENGQRALVAENGKRKRRFSEDLCRSNEYEKRPSSKSFNHTEQGHQKSHSFYKVTWHHRQRHSYGHFRSHQTSQNHSYDGKAVARDRAYPKKRAEFSYDNGRRLSTAVSQVDSVNTSRKYSSHSFGSVKTWSGDLNSLDRCIAEEDMLARTRHYEPEDKYDHKRKKRNRRMAKRMRNGDNDNNGFQRVQDRRNGLASNT